MEYIGLILIVSGIFGMIAAFISYYNGYLDGRDSNSQEVIDEKARKLAAYSYFMGKR